MVPSIATLKSVRSVGRSGGQVTKRKWQSSSMYLDGLLLSHETAKVLKLQEATEGGSKLSRFIKIRQRHVSPAPHHRCQAWLGLEKGDVFLQALSQRLACGGSLAVGPHPMQADNMGMMHHVPDSPWLSWIEASQALLYTAFASWRWTGCTQQASEVGLAQWCTLYVAPRPVALPPTC